MAKIKNKERNFFICIAVVLLYSIVLSGCGGRSSETDPSDTTESGGVTISRKLASFAFDHSDLNTVVGDADYVFIGTVISEDGTEYKNTVTIEDGTEVSDPYTNYTVCVLENMKGNLVLERSIPLQKSGGLSEDGTTYVLYEDDALPVVGGTYIFFAYAQPDGSLLISGPVSNVELAVENNVESDELSVASIINQKDSLIDEVELTSEYADISLAIEDQTETDRQRFVSTYDGSQ